MLFLLTGLALLCVVCADFLLTTVAITDRKLPSRWVSRGAWQVLRRLLPHSRYGRTVIGPLVMAAIAAFWICITALAWSLIFQASATSVVHTDTDQPVNWVRDLAFVGEALSTLGGGTAQPGSPRWELITVLVGVNGMIVLTLSVSFVLNTTQTVSAGRAFLAHAEACRRMEGDRWTHLKALSDLVADLNSVPHALYYSSSDPTLRLPEGLGKFAEDQLQKHGTLEGIRFILSRLPNFHPDEEGSDKDFVAQLQQWSAGYTY